MKSINLRALLFNLVMAFALGFTAQAAVGLNAYAVAGTIFALGLVLPREVKGALFMAVQKEVWDRELVENLYKANPFLNYAYDADSYVYAGKVVHIPVAAAAPGVEKNRSSLPATIVRRSETDITFAIDVYTTNPERLEDADLYELSFDKRTEAINDHAGAMFELIGDWMLRDWFSKTDGSGTVTGSILRTTGGNVAAHLPSATGNRLKFIKEDLKAAQTLMNKNKIPKTERYAIVDSDMMAQLLDDDDLKKRDGANGGEANLKEGVVMRLYGFDIIERPTVLTFTNAATPVVVDPGTAGAATHNAGVLCYHKNAVVKALGQVRTFQNDGVAEYYGDILSALMRAGGRIRRAAGVVAIVQAAGS